MRGGTWVEHAGGGLNSNDGCFTWISILLVFGHIHNVNKRMESNIQTSRKECEAVTLCSRVAAHTLWMTLSKNSLSHSSCGEKRYCQISTGWHISIVAQHRLPYCPTQTGSIHYPIWLLGPKKACAVTAASGWTVHRSNRGIKTAENIFTAT